MMWRGYDLVRRLSQGLEKYLDKQGCASIAEFCGRAQPKIVTFPELDLGYKLLATIDPERCNGCGLCITACDSGAYQAIELVDGKAAVDELRCDGCGLCVGICPSQGIEMHTRQGA